MYITWRWSVWTETCCDIPSILIIRTPKFWSTDFCLCFLTSLKPSRHYVPAGLNSDILCSERVEEFKYLGTTLTNQNSIQEEVKSRLKSGNACYYSVQNLLSSRLLSKNLKIRIYRTIILPVVLYGCESWHWRSNVGWGCLRIGCWGEYLGLRGTR
jgi:hypothetical protein